MCSTKTLLSSFLSIIAFFCSLFNIPFYAVGDEVRMQDFVLTFSDEFSGTSLDRDIWTGHFQPDSMTVKRKGCYWNSSVTQVKDGSLHIPCVYLPEGTGGTGAGWYTSGIDTSESFSQTYGYFECRCILPEGSDIWSAFWLFCPGVTDISGDGQDGTEIDIMESFPGNSVQHNLHWNGYGEAHEQLRGRKFLVKGDPHREYNTYGLEWNQDEYIFYINGRESMRTSAGGVSKVPEFLILSVEMKGENAIPAQRENAPGESSDFIVDYVRVYQYKDLI